MRSSELADLAGVTVRTLRHYHQIGLLAEPPRSSSGYRRYDVGHLVRLLRIRRLTALGVALSELPAVLDDPEAAEKMLDELDRAAAARIEQLGARRATIASLRNSGAPLDLPPELSTWSPTPADGISPERARYEHEQLILLGHLLGPEGPASLAELLGDAGGVLPEELIARFYGLDPDASDDDIDALVAELAVHLETVADRFTDMPALHRQAAVLLDELNNRALGSAQQRVLRRLREQLG